MLLWLLNLGVAFDGTLGAGRALSMTVTDRSTAVTVSERSTSMTPAVRSTSITPDD